MLCVIINTLMEAQTNANASIFPNCHVLECILVVTPLRRVYVTEQTALLCKPAEIFVIRGFEDVASLHPTPNLNS